METNNEVHYIEHKQLNQMQGVTLRLGSKNITADIQQQIEIFNATKNQLLADWTIQFDDLKSEYESRKNFDPCTQSWFAEKDGLTIGVAECYWFDLPLENRRVMRVGVNWRGEYYESPLPDILFEVAEARCREMAARMETDLNVVFSAWTMKNAKERFETFKKHGYQPVRYFFNMVRPASKSIEEHPLPEGIEIRAVKPEEYRKLYHAINEAFRDHWGYTEPNEEEFQAILRDRHFQPHLWKVAWQDDEICGTVLNYIDEASNAEFHRKRGYTETICVRRPWRGKGLAKALITQSIRMFTEMGLEECALGVDADNPSGALKLYQSLGYEEVENLTSIVLGKPL